MFPTPSRALETEESWFLTGNSQNEFLQTTSPTSFFATENSLWEKSWKISCDDVSIVNSPKVADPSVAQYIG